MTDKLNLIADEIISYADGSYRLDYPEEYNALTFEEQGKVDDLVYEQIGECESCGWNFNYENLETVDGHGELCWACAGNVADEDEEEIEGSE
jgi:hypothetical protein